MTLGMGVSAPVRLFRFTSFSSGSIITHTTLSGISTPQPHLENRMSLCGLCHCPRCSPSVQTCHCVNCYYFVRGMELCLSSPSLGSEWLSIISRAHPRLALVLLLPLALVWPHLLDFFFSHIRSARLCWPRPHSFFWSLHILQDS